MPGFYISNQICEIETDNLFNEKSLRQFIENSEFEIRRNTLKKFLDDKVFEENESYIAIVEGIVLNKKKLMDDYSKRSFFETIIAMYISHGEEFFSAFRGPFSGAFYDKKTEKWIVYTNHVGEVPIFYFCNDNNFIISSDLQWITKTLKKKNIRYTLDRAAVYNLLSFGFMIDESTLISEIKRLEAGCYISYNDKVEVKRYHSFVNTNELAEDISENEIISELDSRFANAVRLTYEKDIEYNYQHVAQLSGGLDSRMNVWVADSLGYKDILCTTFSQSDQLDEKIAKIVAKRLNKEHMIKTLDAANFLKDIDHSVKMNHGLSIYSGVAHGNSMNRYICFDNLGALHTGQLGDVIVGTYVNKSTIHNKVSEIKGAYSEKLIKQNATDFASYENEEMFLLYTRALKGVLCTHIAFRNYTELTSPFVDVDLLEYCLSIPLKYRSKHRLYFEWITRKYPGASRIKWEKTNAYITDGKYLARIKFVIGKWNYLDVIKYFANKLKIENNIMSKQVKNNMNPIELWLVENRELQEFFEKYFNENIDNQICDVELKKDIRDLFVRGNGIEKTLVLTALSGIKLFFGEEDVH